MKKRGVRFLVFFVSWFFASSGFSASIIDLTNHQSGISLSLSGSNGTDWAGEQTFFDEGNADLILYVKSAVNFSLAHNANNTVVNIYMPGNNRLLGANGLDGTPNSGDEGIIHYKLDRDQQSHAYTQTVPAWAPVYSVPFNFDTLTYDGSLAVLGKTGDNSGVWGTRPANNLNKFYYGANDSFGNEWHVLTYWDDDVQLLTNAGVNVHRQGASDGHCLAICVNPLTPVIQFRASGSEQYYTTPVKTYHVPKIWEQTTYLTSGVEINFVNLTNAETVQYRVDSGVFQNYSGTPLLASALFSGNNSSHQLEFKCGAGGTICRRTMVYQPDYPAASENHGYLLWANETERQALINKVKNIQPFKYSYTMLCDTWYQGSDITYSDARGGWCSGAGMAGQALNNAFALAIDGPTNVLPLARLAKTRLLRMARLQPVGAEADINSQSPGKDFLNELGQTLQGFANAGVAYDLIAAFFRKSQQAEGMTPIEEYMIRDGLAKIISNILGRMRDNCGATIGGGDSHWAHGYELATGIMALAMPTYKTAYYGASGGDRITLNDLTGSDGKYWNPYPEQGVTWYQAATDPFIATPGYPNIHYPFRAEFLISDDGWWTGPNDLQGNGDRYFTGPLGNRLVDVSSGGLANAECQNELMEMDGYESPFVELLYVFNTMRKIKGDNPSAYGSSVYIRRRLINGVVPFSWNDAAKSYTAQEPRVETAIYAFNQYYDYAGLAKPKRLVGTYLNNLNIYYAFTSGTLDPATHTRLEEDRKLLYDPYGLALCADPASVVIPATQPIRRPIIRPLFKYVVSPGTSISKDIEAFDLNGDSVTVSIGNLPTGAVFDPSLGRISWTPLSSEAGVHILTVSVSNSRYTTTRPFPIIVKVNPGSGPIAPSNPQDFTIELAGNSIVALSWSAPVGVTNVHCYFLYRDGIFFVALPAGSSSYRDTEFNPPKSHARYHISYVNASGGESVAVEASNSYITIPDYTPQTPEPDASLTPTPAVSAPDVKKIRVFPNPYKPGSQGAFDLDEGIVFAGLPEKCSFRLYTLSGELIYAYYKDDQASRWVWAAKNSAGKKVAAGVYIFTVIDDQTKDQIKGRLVIIK